MTTSAWSGAHLPMSSTAGGDLLGEILSEARRRGTAEPVVIHVRPELHVLITGADRPEHPGATVPDPGDGVPLVIDDEIPSVPGYEIHRVPPPPPADG